MSASLASVVVVVVAKQIISSITYSMLFTVHRVSNSLVVAVSAGSGRNDLVIGIDVSGSVQRRRLPRALRFIADIVDDLEISVTKTRVAVVYYSDNAHLLFGFARFSSKEAIIYWILRTPYLGGRTNSAAALRLMVILGSSSAQVT